MKSLMTITGKFHNDASAADCLRRLKSRENPVQDITSNRVEPGTDGQVIGLLAGYGALAGVVIALVIVATSAPWDLLRELGLLTSVFGGAMLGCLAGALIGLVAEQVLSECSETTVTIKVRIAEESPTKETLRAIMEKSGAAEVAVAGTHRPNC